jgi:hypothetical protein
MPIFSNFFRRSSGGNPKVRGEPDHRHGIPTVKFDSLRVTETVEADVRKTILTLPEIDRNNFEQVYDATIDSISAGRDLHFLFDALMRLNIVGMTETSAADIARLLNNRATSLMQREQQTALGIIHAIWLYSGVPCIVDPKRPSDHYIRQDAAHKAADGKEFQVAKGMFLNGKWTWPGADPGCKCVSRSKIPGFS